MEYQEQCRLKLQLIIELLTVQYLSTLLEEMLVKAGLRHSAADDDLVSAVCSGQLTTQLQ